MRIFNLECPSLPITINSELLDARLENLREQPCRSDFLEKLAISRANVLDILQSKSSNWYIFRVF